MKGKLEFKCQSSLLKDFDNSKTLDASPTAAGPSQERDPGNIAKAWRGLRL